MCSTEDTRLMEEVFQYILTKARDQDVVYFFMGLRSNYKARRLLAQFFKDQYDTVGVVVTTDPYVVLMQKHIFSCANDSRVTSRWSTWSRYYGPVDIVRND